MAKIEVLTGTGAAAYAAKLARVEVVPAYPITPQSATVEYIASMIADGELDAEYVEVESENTAMSICQGASIAGCRVFTATSSVGLAYMHSPVWHAASLRLPIVMAIANRAIGIASLWCDHSDAIELRDTGWMQFYAENNQEILDTIIQAYRIAEDKRILLPAMVNFDGFYLSHLADSLEIPDQEAVDEFLPRYKPDHVYLDPDRPIRYGGLATPEDFTEYRYKQHEGLESAKSVITEVGEAYGKAFGRKYGLLDEYRAGDAEAVLVTIGSMTGTARAVVDKLRAEGKSVGLVKLRTYRPFPAEVLRSLLAGKRAVGVVERSISAGSWGSAFSEVRAALYDLPERPMVLGFVVGLGGRDVRLEDLEKAARKTFEARERRQDEKMEWVQVRL